MKKLSLDKTWFYCLKMWRWIARQIKAHPYSSVEVLKTKWLEKNGFKSVISGCFFCAYGTRWSAACLNCPAKKVDRDFHCFGHREYHYCKKPIAFLKEITRLNRIRLKHKKK